MSTVTAMMVASQIEDRWGREESIKYQPNINCLTFFGWKKKGYKVKEGETGLRSFVTKKIGRKYKREYIKVYYYLQVEKE